MCNSKILAIMDFVDDCERFKMSKQEAIEHVRQFYVHIFDKCEEYVQTKL